jgi:PAS domain S-box-containing protein
MQQLKKKIPKVNKTFIDWLLGARAGVEPRQRRRLQLLSAFLLLMTLFMLPGSFSLRSINATISNVMLGTSGLLLCSYFISRTKFYSVAIKLAIILPAIPPTAVVIFKPPEVSLTAELMWLALPLLISSLMLSIRKTIIVAVSYIAFIFVMAATGSLGIEITAPLMAYMLTSAFFVITINNLKENDQRQIENQLKERKHMDQELRESEDKFNKVFLLSPQAICITRLKDGKTIEINESFIRLSGYTREDIIGRTSQELGIWAKPGDREKMLKLLKEHGRVQNEEFEVCNKRGEIHTELVSATPINFNGEECLISIMTNITERKRMENALINEATRRRILIEQSRDGIVVLDQNGKVYEANQRFVDMLGYSPEELSKLHVWDWDAYQTREKLLDRINNIDEAGDHFETKHRHKDGTVYDIELSTNGAMFAGQKLIFCVCRDITERKRAEEKLKLTLTSLEHSTAQLQATNKELESFSYSVSHDLRSPLRSIDGFSQALLEDYANTLDEKGQDYFKRLRGASQKMGELIDGLLKLSRVTRSEMHQEKTDLGILAKDIIGRLKETDPKRHVKVTIGDDLVTNGDSQMMRVLLENLLGNAWKFTAKTQHARIELGRGVNGDKNTFFIKDNGAGFDMAFKDKLFGAFQRFHDTTEFPGTGIGLATVQRIINRHGGSIRAEAEVGKGATFYFTFDEGA